MAKYIENFSLILIFSISVTSCRLYKTIPDFDKLKPVNGHYTGSKYTLLLYAAIGCGYSQMAIRELQNLRDCKDFQLIIIENESESLIKTHQNKYFDKATFFSNEDGNINFGSFFPRYFLYKNGELIWRQKGYTEGIERMLKKRMNCDLKAPAF